MNPFVILLDNHIIPFEFHHSGVLDQVFQATVGTASKGENILQHFNDIFIAFTVIFL